MTKFVIYEYSLRIKVGSLCLEDAYFTQPISVFKEETWISSCYDRDNDEYVTLGSNAM
jgi:hypothetical protein